MMLRQDMSRPAAPGNPSRDDLAALMRGQHPDYASTRGERDAERRLKARYEPRIRDANEAGDAEAGDRLRAELGRKVFALSLRRSARINRVAAKLRVKSVCIGRQRRCTSTSRPAPRARSRQRRPRLTTARRSVVRVDADDGPVPPSSDGDAPEVSS
jgi:hypothetical protein